MSHASARSNPALIPLLSTTATLSLAIYEILFFRTHLTSTSTSASHRASIARALSNWWHNSLPAVLPLILSLFTTSLVSGIRTYRAISPTLQSTRRYVALAGTLLAVAHLAFAPKIADVIQDMAFAYERVGEWAAKDAEEQGRTKEEIADDAVLEGQRTWLRVHYWRTLVTDVPAWGCFAWLVFT